MKKIISLVLIAIFFVALSGFKYSKQSKTALLKTGDTIFLEGNVKDGVLFFNGRLQLAPRNQPISFKQILLDHLPLAKKITLLVIVQKLAALLVDILIGLLLLAFLFKPAESLVKIVFDQPGQALAWGFLKFIFVPIIAVLLLISLIGIPLGVLIFMLYGFSLYVAKLIASLFIGSKLLADRKLTRPYQSFVLGAVVMALLQLVPLVGWLAYFLFILLGLGSLALKEKTAFEQLKHQR
jgi:hypothetical protein